MRLTGAVPAVNVPSLEVFDGESHGAGKGWEFGASFGPGIPREGPSSRWVPPDLGTVAVAGFPETAFLAGVPGKLATDSGPSNGDCHSRTRSNSQPPTIAPRTSNGSPRVRAALGEPRLKPGFPRQ